MFLNKWEKNQTFEVLFVFNVKISMEFVLSHSFSEMHIIYIFEGLQWLLLFVIE